LFHSLDLPLKSLPLKTCRPCIIAFRVK
jgi:hypothetical protein